MILLKIAIELKKFIFVFCYKNEKIFGVSVKPRERTGEGEGGNLLELW